MGEAYFLPRYSGTGAGKNNYTQRERECLCRAFWLKLDCESLLNVGLDLIGSRTASRSYVYLGAMRD